MVPTSWSRDGRFLLYFTTVTAKTHEDLWVLSLADRKATMLLGTEFTEDAAVFSPDGRWVAYYSNESGRGELYVRPFVAPAGSATPSLGDGKWQISKDGMLQTAALNAAMPRWRGDGKELYFLAPGNRVMAVDVNGSGAAFEAGTARALFSLPAIPQSFDVTPDGKRFLASMPLSQGPQPALAPLTVVLNWQTDLKK